MKTERNNFYLGVGVDITYINLFKENFDRLAKKILTKNEMLECLQKEKEYQAQYLASRWAIKEAIWKSLDSDTQNFPLIKIEVLNNLQGKPYCTNFCNAKISISYSKNMVIAFCIFIENK